MRSIPFYFITTLVLFFIACDSNNLTQPQKPISDSEIISLIQNSTLRKSIDVYQLPEYSIRLLADEYPDFEAIKATYAHDRGYEVIMEGQTIHYDQLEVVYFHIEGRRLHGDQTVHHPRGRQHRDSERCFEIIFPITLIMPDASTITLDSAADCSFIRNWYEEHTEYTQKPVHQYPFQVLRQDSIITINDLDELRSLKSECREGRRGESGRQNTCFQFVLPITFLMPDASLLTIETVEDFSFLNEWHQANRGVDEKPELQFPVMIILADGSELEINSTEEMNAVRNECLQGERMGRHGRNGRRGGS